MMLYSDNRISVISTGDKGTDIAKTTVLSVAYINNGGVLKFS